MTTATRGRVGQSPKQQVGWGSLALSVAALLAPLEANASFLSGEALDTAANALAWFVLVLVPVVGIAVFWMVHVLPEKIAHKRHHPQRQAIQTLCLLSLVFGGLLWPIAWLWAYTKPVGYKMAYGTERHEDYFREIEEQLHAGELTDAEIRQLQIELDAMHARGSLSADLHPLRDAASAKADASKAPTGASTPSRSS